MEVSAALTDMLTDKFANTVIGDIDMSLDVTAATPGVVVIALELLLLLWYSAANMLSCVWDETFVLIDICNDVLVAALMAITSCFVGDDVMIGVSPNFAIGASIDGGEIM